MEAVFFVWEIRDIDLILLKPYLMTWFFEWNN